MTSTARRWARPLVGLVVTAVFVWLLARQIDPPTLAAAFARTSGWALLAAVACLAAGYATRIVRWWWMLRASDPEVPLRACVWPFLVSIAVNNLLPFRAGDVLRVMGFRAELRAPAMRLLGTMVVERLLDAMTLLGIFFMGLSGVASGFVPAGFVRVATWMAMAGGGAMLLLLVMGPWLPAIVNWICDHHLVASSGLAASLRRQALHLVDALSPMRAPGVGLPLVACSLVAWAFEGLVFVSIAQGLGVVTAARGPWFALATGTLATLLPSSPGYVGTFDYFAALGLVAYGAERAPAAAFALIVHLVLWLPLTAAGLVYFLRPGARALRRDVAAAVSAQEGSS